MTDRRAKIHIAGPKNPQGQRCTRCHAVIAHDSCGWPVGAPVASYGRGDWSILRHEPSPGEYRACGRRALVLCGRGAEERHL